MIDVVKESLWKHFAASIDMLKNAIILWPAPYWNARTKFFYMAYHTLVFLDYYLTIPPENFSSKLPYTLTEPAGIPKDALDDAVPDRIYTKEELLDYLQLTREKCRKMISGLTEENINQRWIGNAKEIDLSLASSSSMNYSVLDILFYNMKHVQHHSAQLNLLLRQEINKAPDYVSQAEDAL